MTKLALRPEFLAKVAWGRPDSPVRPLCAICHGPLSECPVMLFREDGSGAQFCEQCFEQGFEQE